MATECLGLRRSTCPKAPARVGFTGPVQIPATVFIIISLNINHQTSNIEDKKFPQRCNRELNSI